MKTEISAGGIVVRRHKDQWEVLLMQDMNDAWTFPKGVVEKDEDYETAAKREIQEEVGLTDLTPLTKLPIIRYMYQRNGLISKTVHYFIFESRGKENIVNQSNEGVHNASWVSMDEAIKKIGYAKTNVRLLTQTKEFLSSYGS